jgi:hypothetical protein
MRDFGAESHTYRNRRDVESVKALEADKGEWLFRDAEHWLMRLISGRHYMTDLKVGTVKLYARALHAHARAT